MTSNRIGDWEFDEAGVYLIIYEELNFIEFSFVNHSSIKTKNREKAYTV